MKKFSLVVLSALILTTGVFAKGNDEAKSVYKVDAQKSKITWTGKKVTGQHTGNVSIENGDVYVNGSNLELANIKLNMNSITCTDLTAEEWNQKLIGHLKSEDFFSVEKFPQATFEATGFKTGAGKDQYIVTGKLTIKGITQDISFPATVKVENGRILANGTASIDRTKYNIQYGSGSFFKGLGDNMIYDEFEIEFTLVAASENV